MDKNTLIHYINRLGFNHISDDDSEFMFDENLCIKLEKKVDYYTSWYGNHPYTYIVKFIWFNEVLVKYPLQIIMETDIINFIDRMMEIYKKQQIGSSFSNRWLQYERLKPVLKSMKRDLQIVELLGEPRVQTILLSKDKDKEEKDGIR